MASQIVTRAMSDQWGGPGWWIGGDGMWYPPREPAVVRDRHQVSAEPPDGEVADIDPASIEPTPGSATLGDQTVREGSHAIGTEPAAVEVPLVVEIIEIDQANDPALDAVEAASGFAVPDLGNAGDLDQARLGEVNLAGSDGLGPGLVVDPAPSNAHTEVAPAGVAGVPVGDDGSTQWPNIDLRSEIAANRETILEGVGQRVEAPSVLPPLRVQTTMETNAGAEAAIPPRAPLSVDSAIPSTDSATSSTASADWELPGRSSESERLSIPPAPQVGAPGKVSLPPDLGSADLVYSGPPREPSSQSRIRRAGPILLAIATVLALLSGLLGALWVRERNTADELREALVAPAVAVDDEELTAIAELNDALQDENDVLREQLAFLQERDEARVDELPRGRVAEIADVLFTPMFADEANGRVIAVDVNGEYQILSLIHI